jgi:HAD superfamily hydrolase (TIGR01490 family)
MVRIFSDESMDSKRSAAFFDLDRTLIGRISGKVLVQTAWDMKLAGTPEILKSVWLYVLYKSGIEDPAEAISKMTGWLRGRPVSALDEISRVACEGKLIPSVFPAAKDEISFHRQRGSSLVILSSSTDSICRLMAEALDFDDYLCTTLGAEDGILTGRPAGKFCYGVEKLRRLTGYCTENKLSVSESWYYSDSISDLPVLRSVGHPVCINPDRKLRREAIGRGWRLEDWVV